MIKINFFGYRNIYKDCFSYYSMKRGVFGSSYFTTMSDTIFSKNLKSKEGESLYE